MKGKDRRGLIEHIIDTAEASGNDVPSYAILAKLPPKELLKMNAADKTALSRSTAQKGPTSVGAYCMTLADCAVITSFEVPYTKVEKLGSYMKRGTLKRVLGERSDAHISELKEIIYK